MMRKTAFIGHRQIWGKRIYERMMYEAERQIDLGCNFFTMGTHGEFDDLALSVCRALRKRYPEIVVEKAVNGRRDPEGM